MARNIPQILPHSPLIAHPVTKAHPAGNQRFDNLRQPEIIRPIEPPPPPEHVIKVTDASSIYPIGEKILLDNAATDRKFGGNGNWLHCPDSYSNDGTTPRIRVKFNGPGSYAYPMRLGSLLAGVKFGPNYQGQLLLSWEAQAGSWLELAWLFDPKIEAIRLF